jgi:hypothetical protein
VDVALQQGQRVGKDLSGCPSQHGNTIWRE